MTGDRRGRPRDRRGDLALRRGELALRRRGTGAPNGERRRRGDGARRELRASGSCRLGPGSWHDMCERERGGGGWFSSFGFLVECGFFFYSALGAARRLWQQVLDALFPAAAGKHKRALTPAPGLKRLGGGKVVQQAHGLEPSGPRVGTRHLAHSFKLDDSDGLGAAALGQETGNVPGVVDTQLLGRRRSRSVGSGRYSQFFGTALIVT